MFNFNADLMQLDDGATGTPRVAGPRNEPVSEEELARIMDEENAKYNPTTGIPLSEPEGQVPGDFTPGPFPKELEKFFGSSEGVLGYKIETLTDQQGRTYNQLSVATGPTSSKTFGASFVQGPDGPVIFSPAKPT